MEKDAYGNSDYVDRAKNQQWKLTKVGQDTYKIENIHYSGMVLDASAGSKGKVQIWKDTYGNSGYVSGGKNQYWKLTKVGQDTYKIESIHYSGMVLDASAGSKGKVQIWKDSNGNNDYARNGRNQLWKLLPINTSKVTPPTAGSRSSNNHFDGLCTEHGEQEIERVKTKQYKKPEFGTATRALTATTNNLWPVDKVIKVSIDNSMSQELRMKVFNIAQEWSEYANVSFRLVPSNGEIDVKFHPFRGHWSLVGNQSVEWLTRTGFDIVSIGTMNLQVHEGTSESELRRVVLHEFGHALGFRHEHKNPLVSIPWDKEKVYDYYLNNGYDRGWVDHNVFNKLAKGQTQFSSFDPRSIMAYYVPNSLTIGDYSIPKNTRLSDMDKSFAQVLYPFPNFSGNKVRIALTTGSYGLREKCNANFIIRYRQGSGVKEFQVSLNKGARWEANRNYTKEFPLPSGVGVNDILSATIFWQSVDRVFTDDDADWRINKIRLDFIDHNDNSFPIMDEKNGNPYVDFKGNTNQYFEMIF